MLSPYLEEVKNLSNSYNAGSLQEKCFIKCYGEETGMVYDNYLLLGIY